ncbi:Uncharacterized protein Fot_54810 [Forsythia ovata]|uniref:Uncharacterized protein n=1 Tax=Forsythia ovata TaxID=205694 RepID=A0ABD1P6R8_9LAMI
MEGSSISGDTTSEFGRGKMNSVIDYKWEDYCLGIKGHKSPKRSISRNRRRDIDDEYSSDYGPKHETLKVIRPSKSRQNDSDTDREEDDKRNPSEKRRNQQRTYRYFS